MEYLQPTYTKKKNPFIVYLKLKCNWVYPIFYLTPLALL